MTHSVITILLILSGAAGVGFALLWVGLWLYDLGKEMDF